MTAFADRARSIAAHAEANLAHPIFRADWSGLSHRDVWLRAQQQIAFVELMSEATGRRDLAGLNILDVGCGDGRWLRWMVELGAAPDQVVGVDVSDAGFARARALNPRIELRKLDEVHLPFDAGRFDLITQWVCLSSTPTLALRAHVAAQICRVLKPDGLIFWWDLPHCVSPGHETEPIDPAILWPGWPLRSRRVAPRPRPSECLRPINKIRRLVTPLVDRLGHAPTHLAAVIGPRPVAVDGAHS
jgi:SAM-dependent methyltransferase